MRIENLDVQTVTERLEAVLDRIRWRAEYWKWQADKHPDSDEVRSFRLANRACAEQAFLDECLRIAGMEGEDR